MTKRIILKALVCTPIMMASVSMAVHAGEWQAEAIAEAMTEHGKNPPQECTETPSEPSATYALWLGEDTAARDALFVEFPCRIGAYNASYVYLLADQNLVVTPILFPSPIISEPNSDGEVEIIETINSREVVNPRYDSNSRTMIEHNKWRGLDDAYTETHWGFRDGRFQIMSFAVDARLDGEREPVALIERDIW